MSIDARARAAAGELRAATAEGVRMATMTEIDKESTSRRRTRSIAAVTTAVVVVAGLGAVALTRSGSTPRPGGTDPVASVSGSPTPQAAGAMPICSFDGITCLGGRTVRADLVAPVTVTLPSSITGDDAQTTGTEFEVYVDSHSNSGVSGVTVLEGAVPTQADDPSKPDPTASTTAKAAATWLAARPFVQPTTPVRTTLDGVPAYRVHVVLKPGSRLTGPGKANESSASTFSSGESWAAVTASMHDATYYLLDLPHVGLTVVWSWSFGGSPEDRAAQDAYVHALRFATG
jgi:hypothetical protein